MLGRLDERLSHNGSKVLGPLSVADYMREVLTNPLQVRFAFSIAHNNHDSGLLHEERCLWSVWRLHNSTRSQPDVWRGNTDDFRICSHLLHGCASQCAVCRCVDAGKLAGSWAAWASTAGGAGAGSRHADGGHFTGKGMVFWHGFAVFIKFLPHVNHVAGLTGQTFSTQPDLLRTLSIHLVEASPTLAYGISLSLSPLSLLPSSYVRTCKHVYRLV